MDFPRLPGLVCRVSGTKDKFYEIATSQGILNDNYRASSLEIYNGVVDIDLNKISEFKKLSLHEAASLVSSKTSKDTYAVCNCNGNCVDDRRCKCFKINLKCTSNCHSKSRKKGCYNR